MLSFKHDVQNIKTIIINQFWDSGYGMNVAVGCVSHVSDVHLDIYMDTAFYLLCWANSNSVVLH